MSDSEKLKPEADLLLLTLVRHGEALPLDEMVHRTDFNRPLTDRGRQQARWLGARIHGYGPFEMILVSQALRTTQTWQLMEIAESLGVNPFFEEEAYLAGRKTLQRLIGKLLEKSPEGKPKRILLVGHNPGISHLLEYLSGCDEGLGTADSAILSIKEQDWQVALEGESLWHLSGLIRNPY